MIERFLDLLISHDRIGASALVLDAVREGVPFTDVYLRLVQPVMYRMGDLWECGSLDVAQEHYATAVIESILAHLEPRIFTGHKTGMPMIAASVEGEMHSIGARMVADFFQADGWDTCFLGANVPGGAIVAESVRRKAKLIALSASGGSLMPEVIKTIAAIQESDALSRTLVIVGGALFNALPSAVDRTGADGYAPDARAAVEVARGLVEERAIEDSG